MMVVRKVFSTNWRLVIKRKEMCILEHGSCRSDLDQQDSYSIGYQGYFEHDIVCGKIDKNVFQKKAYASLQQASAWCINGSRDNSHPGQRFGTVNVFNAVKHNCVLNFCYCRE